MFAVTTLSCSVLIDSKDHQCSVDADCIARGEAFADTTCQQNVCVTPSASTCNPVAGETVSISFSIDYTSKTPKPFRVRACSRLDYVCDAPIGCPVTANAGEPLTIPVPREFQGLLEVTSPNTVPAMVFLGRPVTEDMDGWDLTLADESSVALFGAATEQEIDRSLGTIVAVVRDEDRHPLEGAVVTNESGGVGFYFTNMFPDKSLDETTEAGAAGFVNVPLGSTLIGGSYDKHALTETQVISRTGWITYAEVFP